MPDVPPLLTQQHSAVTLTDHGDGREIDDDNDHHYFLYQPLDLSETSGTGTTNKKDQLVLTGVDAIQFANSRLMTPIAEEDAHLSSDEDCDFGTQEASSSNVNDHIYCSISDDDLPSKVFEDSLDSFPDIARPSIGIAPRLPPRKPEFNTLSAMPSSSSQNSPKSIFDKPPLSQGSSESLKSLSTDSSSHTVRNCGTVTSSMMSGHPKAFVRERQLLYSQQPVSIQSSKINKSTSLSSVCMADAPRLQAPAQR